MRTGDEMKRRHEITRNAAEASHALVPEETAAEAEEAEKMFVEMTASFYERRRAGICHVFEAVCGAPPKAEWKGRQGTISVICDTLCIEKNSRRHVEKVLDGIVAAKVKSEEYDPHAPLAHGALLRYSYGPM